MDEEQQRSVSRFYEREAESYDARRWIGPIGRVVHLRYEQLVRDAVADVSGGRVVEVGCGTGRFTEMLAALGFDVLAVDVADAMLEAARRRVAEAGLSDRVAFIRKDATKMSVADVGRADIACSFNALNHIPRSDAALSAMARVVGEGGLLVLGFPSLYSLYFPYAALVNATKRSLRRGVFTRWVSVPTIHRQLKGEGFQLVRDAGMFHAPPVVGHAVADAIGGAIRVGNLLVARTHSAPLASTRVLTFRRTGAL